MWALVKIGLGIIGVIALLKEMKLSGKKLSNILDALDILEIFS